MDIKTTRLVYEFGDEGQTNQIQIGFSANETGAYFNSTLELYIEDLAEGQSFDDMSKKEIEQLGRKKLADLVAVK